MKSITLSCGKKLPIPNVPFSNIEVNAHFVVEYEGDDAKALKHAKEMLAKCLQASMEVANKTEALKYDNEVERLAEKLITNKND